MNNPCVPDRLYCQRCGATLSTQLKTCPCGGAAAIYPPLSKRIADLTGTPAPRTSKGCNIHARMFACHEGQALEKMDSLELLATMVKVETEFGVKVPDDLLPMLHSWKDVEAWLEAHI